LANGMCQAILLRSLYETKGACRPLCRYCVRRRYFVSTFKILFLSLFLRLGTQREHTPIQSITQNQVISLTINWIRIFQFLFMYDKISLESLVYHSFHLHKLIKTADAGNIYGLAIDCHKGDRLRKVRSRPSPSHPSSREVYFFLLKDSRATTNNPNVIIRLSVSYTVMASPPF
jgi:hypothetical protein